MIPCSECGGVFEHNAWCWKINPKVSYAFAILTDPTAMIQSDKDWLKAAKLLWQVA